MNFFWIIFIFHWSTINLFALITGSQLLFFFLLSFYFYPNFPIYIQKLFICKLLIWANMSKLTNLLMVALLIVCPILQQWPCEYRESAWRSATGPVATSAEAVSADNLFLISVRRHRVRCQMHCAHAFRSCVDGCKRLGGSTGTAERCDHFCRNHGSQCYQHC